jgi:hypothetical protein
VLERRGRYQEYLRLSEAAGEPTGHAIMLTRLYRAEEAVEYSLNRLATPEEALAVAGAPREQGSWRPRCGSESMGSRSSAGKVHWRYGCVISRAVWVRWT